mgnify:CR=1 FL=1
MELLKLESLTPYLEDLVAVLLDAVDMGASIGFLPPMSETEAKMYWLKVEDELTDNSRQVLVVRENGRIVATVQIAMSPKANALHRCEVEKLMVLSSARHQGYARALMQGVERVAASMQRQLITLDTRTEDDAYYLYQKIGYTAFGCVPNYARSASGSLDSSTFFYKEIDTTHEVF